MASGDRPVSGGDAAPGYASRGGYKLAAALDHFGVDPSGWTCADLGCSVGGFTDCLLRRGAARVHAVDTAYGQLAWKLRQDERVVVHERTNALQMAPAEPCDLVVIDLGWTKQDRALPVAARWLRPRAGDEPGGRVLTLVKPHYESGEHRLGDEAAAEVTRGVLDTLSAALLPSLGLSLVGWITSPIRGGKGGNVEHLALMEN